MPKMQITNMTKHDNIHSLHASTNWFWTCFRIKILWGRVPLIGVIQKSGFCLCLLIFDCLRLLCLISFIWSKPYNLFLLDFSPSSLVFGLYFLVWRCWFLALSSSGQFVSVTKWSKSYTSITLKSATVLLQFVWYNVQLG